MFRARTYVSKHLFVAAISVTFVIRYVGASYFVRKLGVDDPLDAFAIHGVCGMWGVFAVGLFHTSQGAFYGAGGQLLGWQVAGILAITLWSVAMSTLIFGLLHACNGLRVTDEQEAMGLDKDHHGGDAYAIRRMKTNQGDELTASVELTTMNTDDAAVDAEEVSITGNTDNSNNTKEEV